MIWDYGTFNGTFFFQYKPNVWKKKKQLLILHEMRKYYQRTQKKQTTGTKSKKRFANCRKIQTFNNLFSSLTDFSSYYQNYYHRESVLKMDFSYSFWKRLKVIESSIIVLFRVFPNSKLPIRNFRLECNLVITREKSFNRKLQLSFLKYIKN